MSHLTRAEYVAEARQIEAMRIEAERRRDRSALAFAEQRKASLNRVFWGREFKPAS